MEKFSDRLLFFLGAPQTLRKPVLNATRSTDQNTPFSGAFLRIRSCLKPLRLLFVRAYIMLFRITSRTVEVIVIGQPDGVEAERLDADAVFHHHAVARKRGGRRVAFAVRRREPEPDSTAQYARTAR